MNEEHVSSEYEGFFARWYDISHTDLSDLPFYLELIKSRGGPVLEMGSGTGRLMVPLLEKGVEVTGVEPQKDMIEICRSKFKNRDVYGSIIQATAQDFSVHEKFSLVFFTHDTFRHLFSTLDEIKALMNIRSHIAREGRLIIDLTLPDIEHMVKNRDKEQVCTGKDPESGNTIKEYVTADYDFTKQLESSVRELKEFSGKKCIRHAKTSTKLTFFFPRELVLLLSSCGYSVLNIWKDYAMPDFDSSSRLILIEAAPNT